MSKWSEFVLENDDKVFPFLVGCIQHPTPESVAVARQVADRAGLGEFCANDSRPDRLQFRVTNTYGTFRVVVVARFDGQAVLVRRKGRRDLHPSIQSNLRHVFLLASECMASDFVTMEART